MPEQVHPHGLGGDLVVPDGLEHPAVGGIDEQQDDGDADPRHREGEQHRTELGVGFEHIGAVGDGTQLVVLDHRPDDLRKAQGGDGQVVAFQLQHRQADEGGEQRRHHPGQQDGHRHRQGEADGVVIILVDHRLHLRRDGKDGVGVGPDEHEPRLAQGEQPGEAVEQVHGGRH